MKTKIIYIILFIAYGITSDAQHLVIINNDTTKLFTDSLILKSINAYQDVRWEKLSGDKWVEFNNGIADSSFILLDSPMQLRSSSFDETCKRRVTDTITIIPMQPKVIQGSEFSCDQEGGYFLLSDSTYITVPENAVSSFSTFNIQYESFTEQAFNDIIDNGRREFLFGINLQGDNTLDKRTKLKINTSIIPGNQILQIYVYDEIKQKWVFCNSYTLFSSIDGFFQTHLSNGKYAVFSMPLFSNQTKSLNIVETDSCEQGAILAGEVSLDLSKDDCQVVVNETNVIFFDCGRTTGGIKEHSISKECLPEVSYSLFSNAIKVNEATKVTISVNIAGYPLEGQLVYINAPGNFYVNPNSKKTDKNGNASFILTGKSEALPAIIEYSAVIGYHLTGQHAYSGTQSEKNVGEMVHHNISDKFKLMVIDDCTDPESINCSVMSDPGPCEQIKSELPILVSTTSNPIALKEETSRVEGIIALSQSGNANIPNFYARTDNPRIAGSYKISNENIAVVGLKEGNTTMHLRWCDNDEEIVVNVTENNDCDKATVKIYPSSLKIIKGVQYKLRISYGYDPEFIPKLSFSSNSQNVIVEGDGRIIANKVGNAEITVSWCDDEYHKIIPVEVVDQCNSTNVFIGPVDMTILKGGIGPLTITYETINDDEIFVPFIRWKTNDGKVAGINGSQLEGMYVAGVDTGSTTVEATWCDNDIQIIDVTVIIATCQENPLQTKCSGIIKSSWMYAEFHTNSPGGTFLFDYYLDYRVVYEIIEGKITDQYVEVRGKFYYNYWGWTYFDGKRCSTEGEECITHIKFEVLEENLKYPMSGKIRVTCTYSEGLEEEESYNLNFLNTNPYDD